ncbi:glycoside hydrolase family 15 protein [Streptomyces wuyuanensis]|uniref:Glucoamylase (Glucan-1,4-alpha-glucosidase), GH15 family n=1 Tax=Streptomyces wuyuanensis TaxID=1196353 RepID=A0A1G9NCF6_9ACTN|nr:glycoside hydrolase family 15 protein [Streptomyces wuyuanensis]SDL83767.1 Glucoamylase (glucan-1,4-alpha-glucosidase), GH15 family [Streptomyces wuyuanensis]
MGDYPLIEDHGLIGDLQTAALISTQGTIDWYCTPRFDSPSVFGSLLDSDNGGYFKVAPVDRTYATKQLYLPDTAVLVTRFMTEAGAGEVVDFMPVTGPTATRRHRLVRLLRCVRGSLTFKVDIVPRFNYGRSPHKLHYTERGAVFAADDLELTVHAVREPEDVRLVPLDLGDHDMHFTLTLEAGQERGVVLETFADGPPRHIHHAEFMQLFDETVQFWRDWLSQSRYSGRWREAVERSAITLKLMTYAPTGAIVAAPTAGLPEQLGGERNWDYRFTWIRDASFSVYALLGLGFTGEAQAFIGWLRDRVHETAGRDGESGPLNIMYRVDGSSDLEEDILDNWAGYEGSSPVRIGNGAASQLQLDIYGEALDSIFFAHERGIQLDHRGWTSLRTLLDWLTDHWDQPDEGLWETRGGRKNFTYGRVMSWVAFDRALRLAAASGRPASLARWSHARDRLYHQVLTRGWNEERQAFVQHYDTDVLDSSLVRMSTVGFITPDDPMWTATLDAMDRELVNDSLVYRYNPEASPDGLRGSEGTFSLCTFMYVDALARAGRLNQSRLVLEKMLTYANHLGLYSEEIDLTGRQLGNFPQAFTHLAFIDTALTLDAELNRARGESRPRHAPAESNL